MIDCATLIHFFNKRGHSILSTDHLHSELKRHQDENEELQRISRAFRWMPCP